jgi:hypothetical protein
MLEVSKLIAQGAGLAPVLLKRAASVELDWDVRQKSRFDATDSAGRHLGVFLPRGTLVRGGDVLVAADGSLVRVIAAPQPVLRITPSPAHRSPFLAEPASWRGAGRDVGLLSNNARGASTFEALRGAAPSEGPPSSGARPACASPQASGTHAVISRPEAGRSAGRRVLRGILPHSRDARGAPASIRTGRAKLALSQLRMSEGPTR